MVFYLLIIVSNSNMLICFTDIKAKKDRLGEWSKGVYKILFVKVGNLRIVACQCPFEGSQRLIIFTVSPTDSTFQIGF